MTKSVMPPNVILVQNGDNWAVAVRTFNAKWGTGVTYLVVGKPTPDVYRVHAALQRASQAVFGTVDRVEDLDPDRVRELMETL